MDELIKLVASKTGISEEQAKTSVETVLGFLKQKLPAPMADQVENVLHSDVTQSGLGNVAKTLGGLFGGKK